jgi:hypothetical protein
MHLDIATVVSSRLGCLRGRLARDKRDITHFPVNSPAGLVQLIVFARLLPFA